MKLHQGYGLKALLMGATCMTVSAGAMARSVPKMAEVRAAQSSTVEQAVSRDLSAGRPAVRRVKLSGDFFALKPAGGDVPLSIREAKIRLDFGGQQPTFDDLLMLLEDRGLSVIMGWDDGSYGDVGASAEQGSSGNMPGGVGGTPANGGSAPAGGGNAQPTSQGGMGGPYEADGGLRARPLPFRRYEGTLGGLFRQIQRSMGVTIWWNEGIYVSPVGRYSVMLPQNSDLMKQVVSELKAKGARNVVSSMQAGTVSFVAPGALAEEAIRPYLTRLGRNASEVTMQIALVSVTMNEQAAKGFDWSAFNFAFGTPDPATTVGAGGSAGIPSSPFTGGSTGTAGTATAEPRKSLFSLGANALSIYQPAAKLLGMTRPLDITGAIKFLSNFGETSVDQNVELRTLAGTTVNWRSGETIPYVSGVSATTTGGGGGLGGGGGFGGAVGAAQTEKLETGLTLKLAPNYEAAGGLVTVAFNLELTELIEFLNLNAGNQLGTLTQPRTREQKLDDIVRIPVGETVVLGGLRRQLASTDRNGPFGAYGIGKKNRRNETQTVFVVMRPVVTIYEVAGLEQPMPQKSNEITVGNNGEPWAATPEDYRGTNMFGARANQSTPDRRRSMAQPEASGNE